MPQWPKLEPYDPYNQTLESHVHPPDWQNPKPSGRYHLVVIGGGTAGLVTAAGAAGLGAKVALIERELLGGDCLNVGCVPSKAIIRSARTVASVRAAHEFGVHVSGETHVDFSEVMMRMRRLRAKISPYDSARRFRDLGVDVFLGPASFRDTETVEVAGETLRFKRAVIATGGRPHSPPIEGLKDVSFLTNETIFSLTALPARLAVIGAGPVGCELAQCFARFGSDVWLVASQRGILPKEDRDAADIVRDQLIADGIHLLYGARQLKLQQEGQQIRFRLDAEQTSRNEMVDQLLIAAGRTANVEGLNLEAVDVDYDTTGVHVNDKLQTTNSRIYAAGDVCSSYKFTHAADFMARTVIRNALFMGRAKMSNLTIPWCTYTSPELAHVGMQPAEAAEQGIQVDTFTQPFDHVDRAMLEGEDAGFVRIHTRKRSGRIIGATVVAPNAGDLISEITLAMNHGIGLSKIANTIHPYPTQAEAIRKVGDMYHRTKLTPLVKSLFRWWLGNA